MGEDPIDTVEIVQKLLEAKKYRKLYTHEPYDWQRKFHDAGKGNPERLLMAANGVGKTLTGGYETAVHLTGEYPDWWEGHRFTKPPVMWASSISADSQKEYVQPVLLGPDLGESYGTGFIPKDKLGKPATRQAGISGVVDTVTVKHAAGRSQLRFKTYKQGWRAFQGAAPDGVWMDEQHDETNADEKGIFSEIQTRVLRTKGIIYATLTPLLGETEFITHFISPEDKGIFYIGATWDDAPHLDKSARERLEATYPPHERDARTKGVPMLGSGAVWPVPQDQFTVDPFNIPDHFARICGVDFGIDHPAAGAWIAWDRDRDIIYLYDCYRKADTTPDRHAVILNRRGKWIPVAWPHDGMQRGKADGRPLKDQYRAEGVNMMSESARYKKDTGGAQPVEPIVLEIYERMLDGRFKVFSDQSEWFDEFRSYHRKDGKIVDRKDDILKATMYAVMMRRFAVQPFISRRQTNQMPAAVRI